MALVFDLMAARHTLAFFGCPSLREKRSPLHCLNFVELAENPFAKIDPAS
jgi:hypothetical protein